MAFASANLTQLRYKTEASFGTTPAGNGKNIRCTDTSNLTFALTTDTSKEIRSDRQVTDSVLTGASATGSIPFELSYREYDPFMEATLQGTWGVQTKWDGTAGTAWGTDGVGAAIPTSATISLDVDHHVLTAGGATSGSSIFTNLAKGQWVRLSGSSIAGQNIIAQVSKTEAPTATELHFEGLPFVGALGDGGAAVKVNTFRLSNGTTQRSFSIEREHADITQFFLFRGMTAGKMSMSFQSGSIVTGSFDFTGKDSVRDGATQMGTPTASLTYGIMNAVAGVGHVYEDGVALTNTSIKSLSLDLDNSLRAQDAIGTLGAVGIGSGTCMVSGSMEVYLADGALYDKFVANENTSLSWSATDTEGNGYVFTLPNVKLKDVKVTGGSQNTDAMLSVSFDGLMDPVLLKTLVIDRVGNGV
jgi:hypothetical protein